MHPNNPLNSRYDFITLLKICPELKSHVIQNKLGDDSINFDNPVSVRLLNKAILHQFYQIKEWNYPAHFLCPPIPGRADYLYWLNDLIGSKKIAKGLDIGVGANCIYPLIGHKAFGWSFVGSDINLESIGSARSIIKSNHLNEFIDIRHQQSKGSIFQTIINSGELFDFSICNPPFHSSLEEAQAGTIRKRKNLSLSKEHKLNFGGKHNELFCEGGEKAFIGQMIKESFNFSKQIQWFTTLVSKEVHLPYFQNFLKEMKCSKVEIIPMNHGQKKSRILAWTYQ
jgi:23S rRNA (adenine1618-N6)-methyltransferase